jgi:hypothetical protein
MHTFAQQPKTVPRTASTKSMKPSWASCAQSREAISILQPERMVGNQLAQPRLEANLEDVKEYASTTAEIAHLGHDFSRIPGDHTSPVQLQAKLTVNTPADVYEQEANRTAEELMRMPELQHKRASNCGGEGPLRQVAPPSQAREHVQIQRVQASDAGKTSAPPIVEEVIRSPGQPLDEETLRFMESRLDHDFARVRVHTHEQATRSAQELGALAYTVGSHVVFQKSRFTPGTREGKELLAHELVHVVQQGAAAKGQTSSPKATSSERMVQRQQDNETSQPAATPASQPATSGAGITAQAPPVSGPVASPRSSWTPDVPYIWFDLHDFYRARTNPAGPYLYSSFVRRDRTDNPNFSNNLNPGPVRDTTTVIPGGPRAHPNDLLWFFYTKFFVDSAASPLPPAYTRFETSADIRFAPTASGQGFEDHFADNSPQYLSPGGLSFPFPLGTNPYGFRAQHPIMQPGVLQWDARLRVSMANTDIPIRLEYSALPQFPDVTAFRAELVRLGIPLREAAPGEAVPTYRLTFSVSGAGRYIGNMEIVSEDGTPGAARRLETGESPSVVVNAMALVVAIGLDPSASRGQFGSSSDRHVEIAGSQRVRFDFPSQ